MRMILMWHLSNRCRSSKESWGRILFLFSASSNKLVLRVGIHPNWSIILLTWLLIKYWNFSATLFDLFHKLIATIIWLLIWCLLSLLSGMSCCSWGRCAYSCIITIVIIKQITWNLLNITKGLRSLISLTCLKLLYWLQWWWLILLLP